MAGRKGAVKGGFKLIPVTVPQTDLDKKFCEEFLSHGDALRAWLACGWKPNPTSLQRKYKKYEPYLAPFMKKKAEMAAEKLAVDQEGILAKMASIAYADPASFVVREEIEQNGKKVHVERMKRIHELTPNQVASITLTGEQNGVVQYETPSATLRNKALRDLGQHLGMFHPKLIHEHRHMHLHAALTLKDVNAGNLQEAERALIKALGPKVAHRMLGITQAELDYEKSVDKG